MYAQSQETQRLAALSGVSVSVIASAALKIVRHSSGRNAFSRSLFALGTVILTFSNGFREMRLCSTAQRKIVLAAVR